MVSKYKLIINPVFLYLLILLSCTSDRKVIINPADIIRDSPVLSPAEALLTFEIEEGFEIEIVASEPLIHDPVALTFDRKGRMWVVEMKGYMPNIDGELEDSPNGTIKILEDTDDDGLYDHQIIIVDSLVLPRALCLVYGGLLYAAPPNLWFAEIEGDHVVNTILIDSMYASTGNVEHQPNGLLYALDNWIYSSKSDKRYRKINDKWKMENTEFRGQWGISQTDDGLLVYNTNSNQLRGDLLPPSSIIRNKGIRNSKTIDIELVHDQRVYPIRPTTGINRGYSEGMLDSLGRLTAFTAACGPLIYSGGNFPEIYNGNGFVAEPSGNLIKRNILIKNGLTISGKQAKENHEFLASIDERFRPVNLYTGPDGNMYVVDMYRGIIQHITYLTNYLKDQIHSRNLDSPIGLGRIYRIKPENNNASFGNLEDANAEQLITALGSPNRWIRMKSQQMLIERGGNVKDDIEELLVHGNNAIQKIHGIWVLEGIDQLSLNTNHKNFEKSVLKHFIRAGRSSIDKSNAELYYEFYVQQLFNNSDEVDLEIAVAAGDLAEFSEDYTISILKSIIKEYPGNPIMEEAIFSSSNNIEEELIGILVDNIYVDFNEDLQQIIENKKPVLITGVKSRGSKYLYEHNCLICHGADGKGIQSLGPPLAGSDWVTGDKDRLIALVLFGREGPINVNGKIYALPDIADVMPGIGSNQELGNSNLIAIFNYIRSNWGNDAADITSVEIQKIRLQFKGRQEPFKASELN